MYDSNVCTRTLLCIPHNAVDEGRSAVIRVSVSGNWVTPHQRVNGEWTDEVRHREGKILLRVEMQDMDNTS